MSGPEALDADAGFALVAAERRAFADQLEALTEQQWATPSLCGRWTVRHVVAHTMVGPTASLGEVLRAMAGAAFRFDVANDRLASARVGKPTAELIGVLRERATSRFTPPGFDWHAPLADLLIHRLDCLAPLGVAVPVAEHTETAWRETLTFLLTRRARGPFVPRGLPALTLVAPDVGWDGGAGPRVEAPAEALGLALCGRTARLEELTGPGAEAMRAWAEGR